MGHVNSQKKKSHKKLEGFKNTMSILPQKLKVKKNNITEEINIYDNQADVGPDFIRAGGGVRQARSYYRS